MKYRLSKVIETMLSTDIGTVDLGMIEPLSSNNSALNLINTWFNSADHSSALTPSNKDTIERYLLTDNDITNISRIYYRLQGNPDLYRGLHTSHEHGVTDLNYNVGDIIDGSLDSWTSDINIAKRYANDDGVILKLSLDDPTYVLLVDKVVHSNDYYLKKDEYLIRSTKFIVNSINYPDELSDVGVPIVSISPYN